ncbi:MAG: tetratricopeptide repeat protein [Vulcanimicrobiota bacterium]
MDEKATVALQKYSTLVRLNPDDPEAHFGLAMAHEEADQMADAFREYQTVIRLDPTHARSHLHLGFLYAKGNETSPAIKEWQKAYELDPKIHKYFDDPSFKSFYGKRIKSTLTIFQKPISIRPDDSWGYYQLALANRYFNRKEIALSHLKKAVELNSNLWEAYNAAGEVYAEIGQYHFAKFNFQKAIDVNPKYTETFYNLGSIFEEEGLIGQAIRRYERGLETNPRDPKLLLALGRAYLKQGQYKKAISKLQKSIDQQKGNSYSHFLLAKACESIYKPDFAIKEYEFAIKYNPKYAEAHYNLGTLQLQVGDPQKAIHHLEETLKLNPADSYAHYNLGNAYEKVGNDEKAINHYYSAISLNSKDAFARYNLGQIYFKLGRFEESIQELRKTLEITPKDPNIYYLLGRAYQELYDLETATEMYHKAVDIRPSDFKSQYELAKIFMNQERFDVAVAQLKKVIRLRPDDAMAHYEMGKCLYRVNAVDQAFDEFQEAIKLDSSLTKAKYGIGLVYAYHRNKPSIAIDFFNQILEEEPDFLPAIIEKGYSYLNLKKYEDAQTQFENALEKKPEDPDILIGIGEVYTESEQYDKAEKIFQKVILLDPENPHARGKYARYLYKTKNYEDAIEQYQKAITMDTSNNPDYYFELAEAYMAIGNIDEARSSLINLAEVDHTNKRAKDAIYEMNKLADEKLKGMTIKELLNEPDEIVLAEAVSTIKAKTPAQIKKDETEGGFLKPRERLVRKRALSKKTGLKDKLKDRPQKSYTEVEDFSITPEIQDFFNQALTVLAKGERDEAYRLFENILKNIPTFHKPYYHMAEIWSSRNDKYKARKFLEKGLEFAEEHDDEEYVNMFNRSLKFISVSGKARSLAQRTGRTNMPKASEPVQAQGTSLLSGMSGELPGLTTSDTAVPVSSATNLFSGMPGADTGEIIRSFRSLSDDQLEERLEVVEDFIDLGKYDKAKEKLQKLVSEVMDEPRVYKMFARVNKEMEEWGEYADNFLKYLNLSGKKTKQNLYSLLETLEQNGEVGKISMVLKDILDLEPENTELLEKLIALLMKDEKYDEAIPYLKQLTAERPEDPRYLFHLARAYRNMKKYALATVQYQKVLKLTEAPEMYNELGYTYEKTNKVQSAIKAYNKTLEFEPDNITANLSLILLYEKAGEYQKAVQSIKHTTQIASLTPKRKKILQKKMQELESKIQAGKGGDSLSAHTGILENTGETTLE